MKLRLVLPALLVVVGLALTLEDEGRAQAEPQIVYVVNESSVPSYKLEDALPAFQAAIDDDFGPSWNAYAQLQLVAVAPAASWVIELLDTPVCMDCGGYHELRGGAPHAVVGARVKGANWEQVFTHEMFEMLADPYVDRASYVAHCHFGTCISGDMYAVEPADPVEATRFSYRKTSPYGRPVVISDFVTPNWYNGQVGGKLDFVGAVKRNHQLLSGGYSYVCHNGMWKQLLRYEFKTRRLLHGNR